MTGARGRFRAALLAGAAALSLPAAAPAATLSGELFAERLADPVAALAPLPPGLRTVLPSSHDRTGGNLDGGMVGGWLTRLGMPTTIIRREPGGYVLLEYDRPGCLLRTYMAGTGSTPGDTSGFGNLQLFFDGEATPRFDQRAADLFAGRDPRYPAPLTTDWRASSGGNMAMVPFCFSRSLKVRTSRIPADGLGYWQANVLLAPPGTPVTTYDPGLDLRAAAAAVGRRADPPPSAPDLHAEGDLTAGEELRAATLAGAGTVRYLRFGVEPFTTQTLGALRLRVTAGGASSPQIDVPLNSMMGDGLRTRGIRSAGFGMDPGARTGYLALPIPYADGATISVHAETGARVTVDGWTAAAVAGADPLFGEHHVETAPLGSDTRVLDAEGSGRVASIVLDDVDGGPLTGIPPLQRMLEGDERVHVDGSRSPTHYGTGHEESSNGGWYYILGAYSGAFGGAGVLGTLPSGAGTHNQHRVFADDAARWSSGIAYGTEHGGGDELLNTVAVTTFSYRGPATLRETDALDLGDPASLAAHAAHGDAQATRLTAYFEGQRDGNGIHSTIIAGGSHYPAPPPTRSPEGVTAAGARFTGTVGATLRIDPANAGVVLRGLFDQGGRRFTLAVTVDGAPAGTWTVPSTVPNRFKRWIEDDLDLPAAATAGKDHIELALTPVEGETANLYGLRALSRTVP